MVLAITGVAIVCLLSFNPAPLFPRPVPSLPQAVYATLLEVALALRHLHSLRWEGRAGLSRASRLLLWVWVSRPAHRLKRHADAWSGLCPEALDTGAA